MAQRTSIDVLPENQEFVLEIINKKPGWFNRYGGYVAIVAVLIIVLSIYLIFRENGIL